jgi:hypothetical protein
MDITVDELAAMSQTELDDLFRRSPMGEIPDGDAIGTAIVKPGTPIAGVKMQLARWLAWQGKVFDRAKGELVNKVSPVSLRLIKADVYVAPSWLDGEPAIILDYSKKSFVARSIRDEIREIEPGTYLGVVWYGRVKTINFVLEFPHIAALREGVSV